MKLLIRADANARIASGHIRRCLSIAAGFVDTKVEIVFVCSELEAKRVLDGTKYKTIILENDYREKDREILLLKDIIHKEHVDGILVDSYEVTERYLSELGKVCRVAYIATMKDIDFTGNLLINYTQYAKQKYFDEKYSKLKQSGFLLQGEKYVPLRKEFFKIPHRDRKKIKNILITTGGSDPDNMSYAILMACMSISQLKDMSYTVVVGNYFKNVEQLEKLQKKNPKIVLKHNVSNMSELMKYNDVAVSAGGTTVFEVCACGLPAISFSMADNQIPMAEYFDQKELIPYSGDERTQHTEVLINIRNILCGWTEHIDKVNEQSKKMQSAIDGLGAQRIAKKLMDMMKG